MYVCVCIYIYLKHDQSVARIDSDVDSVSYLTALADVVFKSFPQCQTVL